MFEAVLSQLDELLRGFRFADAADILLIAILVYSAMLWALRTASRQIVIGVSVLLAVYFLAQSADMYLTSLVFQTAFAVLLVMLVVVFQEEIRRAFEQLAAWGTLKEFKQTPKDASEVDLTVETVFKLAAGKTGALIVLPGQESVERHVHGGIDLSGRVSQPLLLSIFDPGSAGHDGAVILVHGWITKFAVHLPISKNPEKLGGRGTRHSAALGISERCDALAIVVSEERGTVSVAQHGRLTSVQTTADLKNRIDRFLEDRFPVAAETGWRRFAIRHIPLKLLAVGVASVAWFVLAFNVEKMQTSFVVPIEYRNVPNNAQVDESAPSEALVTVSGPERVFRLLDRRVLKIVVDLGRVSDERGAYRIHDSDVRRPPNLDVDRIQPSEIPIRLGETKPARP